ncbi:hypothetical protein NC653_014274 [Populus alba x Populus x berolinensis]|uniref:Uncharacterized protein n=1 Tax=Populus alba x Populus x berolinensis TaxID=444605 RepID=A0AAD6QWI9_9ROSI|nr:hypothetical protein NC653_014274 [Populus alba x Populus x berolinensis]
MSSDGFILGYALSADLLDKPDFRLLTNFGFAGHQKWLPLLIKTHQNGFVCQKGWIEGSLQCFLASAPYPPYQTKETSSSLHRDKHNQRLFNYLFTPVYNPTM